METQDERFFSPSEQEQIRKNLREGHDDAMKLVQKRRVKVHPRIIAMKKEK